MTKNTRSEEICNKLLKLIESVSPEYKEQFFRNLLNNSVFRLRILAVFLLCGYVIQKGAFLFYAGGFDEFFYGLSNRNAILNYVEYGSLAVLILFLVFTGSFSKNKKSPILWAWCYLFVIYGTVDVLLAIFLTDSAFEVLSYFTITLFIYLFVPDFKMRLMPPLVFYILTALMASRLSITYLIEFELIIFFIFLSMGLVKISHYNARVKVFVNALQLQELNENLLRANKELESLSVTDELTKLNNRRSFMGYFEMIWKQASRMQYPVSALMIDIDYFKKYNDALGHLEGDRALVAVAQCLKNQARRATDFVARFGGEEFVCLLPYSTREDAEDFAKHLVRSVEDMKIPHPDCEHSRYLTISAGMASIIPGRNDMPARLLDEADKALYTAKQSGRNRVAVN